MSMHGQITRFPEEKMDPGQLIIEARARIIWGESIASVREFLITNGLDGPLADARIKDFVRERNIEIRKWGVRNIAIGVVLLAIAGLATYSISHSGVGYTGSRQAVGPVLAGVYGLWKLANGIIQLVRPQCEHQSISDLEGTDMMG
jgi:hypothetical protein